MSRVKISNVTVMKQLSYAIVYFALEIVSATGDTKSAIFPIPVKEIIKIVKAFFPFSFICFCFELHEQFFGYLATAVTITDDRAANLDLCLALMAFSSESFLTCHTYCHTGLPF
jgi:TRAP-type C4-dicarboxylate transport system permease small subunit